MTNEEAAAVVAKEIDALAKKIMDLSHNAIILTFGVDGDPHHDSFHGSGSRVALTGLLAYAASNIKMMVEEEEDGGDGEN